MIWSLFIMQHSLPICFFPVLSHLIIGDFALLQTTVSGAIVDLTTCCDPLCLFCSLSLTLDLWKLIIYSVWDMAVLQFVLGHECRCRNHQNRSTSSSNYIIGINCMLHCFSSSSSLCTADKVVIITLSWLHHIFPSRYFVAMKPMHSLLSNL